MELCFTSYEGFNYDLSLLHIDCVDLFAYYNGRMIQSLVKAVRRSMEAVRMRADTDIIMTDNPENLCEKMREDAIFKASIELHKPNFILKPSMPELQNYLEKILLNIVETCYAVETWGVRAKCKRRVALKKIRIDEHKHEKNWFKLISEHNEVVRYKLNFTDSIIQFEKKVNGILCQLRSDYEYLWDEKREKSLADFVKSEPLLADIRDKFKLYDDTTAKLKKLSKYICIQAIQIDRDAMLQSLIEESNTWKLILGAELTEFYHARVENIANFRQVMEKKLARELKDYDDCSRVFKTIEEIQEHFYFYDRDVEILCEMYDIFTKFNVSVPKKDHEIVDSLKLDFSNLMKYADEVHQNAIKCQNELLKELTEGLEKFEKDYRDFEDDYEKSGPMDPLISIKESSNRVMIFNIRIFELQSTWEHLLFNSKIAGLPDKQYPMLQVREDELDAMETLYKLFWDYQKFIESYLQKPFKILNVSLIIDEFGSVQQRSIELEKLPGDTKQLPAYSKVRDDVNSLALKLPLLELMSHHHIEEEQWTQMEQVTGCKFDAQSDDFTLEDLLEAPLLEHMSELDGICRSAIKAKEDEEKDDFLFAPRN